MMNNQWKLVPVEPTREMLVAALKNNGACPIYAAMLDAAPAPSTGSAPELVAYHVVDEFGQKKVLLPGAEGIKRHRSRGATFRGLTDIDHVNRLLSERDALQLRLNAADQRIDELERDKARLDALEANCWDVRYESSPNGDAGDSSISIEVVGHWMAEPHERVIGENYHEDLRAAIDQAMAAPAYPPARPEYPENESAQNDDWHMNPCKQGHRDVGASGGVAHCYTCGEEITAATTQEAFEQWNATHAAVDAAPEAKP